jgi:hypothetical protein
MKGLKESLNDKLNSNNINESSTQAQDKFINYTARALSHMFDEEANPRDVFEKRDFFLDIINMRQQLGEMKDNWESGKNVRSSGFHKKLGAAIAKYLENKFELITSNPEPKDNDAANEIAKHLGISDTNSIKLLKKAYVDIKKIAGESYKYGDSDLQVWDPKCYSLGTIDDDIYEFGKGICFYEDKILYFDNGYKQCAWNNKSKKWDVH